mmetsp:Transcript_19193/g.31484  ORF Transcript_19193/g.31484 Transcript_19193/m.31484 type:complete len:493 (+) Transcript_19193:2-1480(+)
MISEYSVGSVLGKGGFAKVYSAKRRGEKGGRVAIKVFDKSWLAEKRLLGRVEQEVGLHRSLGAHPNVVKFFSSFQDKKHLYIVLEICAGGNLFQYLKKNKPLEPSRIKRWFGQIVSGLKFLHDNDVVHRDLKLSNMLITSEDTIKIADFGLAARIRDYEHHTICGTPNYMAPEVRHHNRKSGVSYDAMQADLWSLGCLLYALFTGGRAIGGKYTDRVKDDCAHELLVRLLSEKQDRPSAAIVLESSYLAGERLSYVRIDIGNVRGVQHVFGSHLVQIKRNGDVVLCVIGSKKTILVSEWMPSRFSKLQHFCAKAVAILRTTTPKVVLRSEPLIAAVMHGVCRVWLQKQGVHATYDMNAPQPVVVIGKKSYDLTSHHVPEKVKLVQGAAVRCLQLERDLSKKSPVFYPVIVHDDQVTLEGVGTGMRTSKGKVNVHLEDGTSISLDKTGSVVTCENSSFALIPTSANSHLPVLPNELKRKMRDARSLISQLILK